MTHPETPSLRIVALDEVARGSCAVRDAVASALRSGHRPLVLGGCCSIVPGALAGARRELGPLGLAFVDGHLDTFDGTTSGTGELAGMDLAVGHGHGPEALTDPAGQPPTVRMVGSSWNFGGDLR